MIRVIFMTLSATLAMSTGSFCAKGKNSSGSASPAAQAAEADELVSVLIEDVPHVRQKPDFCGEACVAMWLHRLGRKTSQEQVFDASGLSASVGRGCHSSELFVAIQRLGLDPGPKSEVWRTVEAQRSSQQMEDLFTLLHADLKAGVPSIVCMRYDTRPNTTEHFRLILGYDPKTDEVIFHEPAEEKGAYRRMPRSVPSLVQSDTTTSRTPPDISLPITTPPWARRM